MGRYALILLMISIIPSYNAAPSTEVATAELDRLGVASAAVAHRDKRQLRGVFYGCGGLCLGQICPINSVCAGVNTQCKTYFGSYGICTCLNDFLSNPGGWFTDVIGQDPIYGCFYNGNFGFTTVIPALGVPGFIGNAADDVKGQGSVSAGRSSGK